jgi:hypothetical protein
MPSFKIFATTHQIMVAEIAACTHLPWSNHWKFGGLHVFYDFSSNE